MITESEYMGKWFKSVTIPQSAVYNERMREIRPYIGSPRWNREYGKVTAEFERSVADAADLYRRAMEELEAFGEITEETDQLLTDFSKENVA
jgi:hypothetical protein